jgi:hypothetical protein
VLTLFGQTDRPSLGGGNRHSFRLAILLSSFTPAPLGAAAVLSESPTAVAPGETVVATWSGVDMPSPRDWIGLYLQDDQDEQDFNVNSWVYTGNCTHVPDSSLPAKASGDCPLVLPGNLPPGVYELHLLANGTFARLAKSDPFTVTGPIQIVSFNINNGDASTTSHTVTLDFATAPTNSGDPNPVPDAFRAVEGTSEEELFAKAFVPLPSATSAPFTLAPRGRDGVRYGSRPILLQVKAGSLLSPPRSDSIRLDPRLRGYTIGSEAAFAYAERHGYIVTKELESAISDPDDDCNYCVISQSSDHPCTYTMTITFFTGKELKPFWRLKEVEAPSGFVSAINQNVVSWIFGITMPPDPSRPENSVGCFFPEIPTAALTFEGPIEDDFVDRLQPWKNAFSSPFFRLITPKKTFPLR